jgi:ATP-binding cassette subfamily B protein/subfamily B ATP-binding cassette protein MsbA
MVFHLRCRLFDHMQRLSLSFHDATTIGDSLHRVAWSTYCAQTLFNTGLIPAVTAAITLTGIATIMLRLDPIITLAALLVSLPLVLIIRGLDRTMNERSLHVQERESDVSTRVQETLSGIRAVQAFAREGFESERFRRHAAESLRASLRLTTLQTGYQAIVGLVLGLGTVAVIGLGAARALRGSLTTGELVLLVSYVGMLFKPLETLAYTASTVQGAAAGAQRVFELLDSPPTVQDAPDAIDLPVERIHGGIAFKNVSFGYRPEQPVLRNLNLSVSAGTRVAFVGASGAGKTTLMSLLPRFYDPVDGGIMLDGWDLRRLTLTSLRRSIAVVPQEPVLFSASVRENIAYARPQATLEEITAAAQAAGVHEFITRLPDGYESQIGERGVNLSGGQRQRLSIARAVLKDAPVLILDEPTSALDTETETRLVHNINELTRGRTTLIIAHRLSTIRNADLVVVLNNGEIAEQGTHEELLLRNGIFKQLYESQFRPLATDRSR